MARFESYGVGIPRIDLQDLSGWLIVIEGTDGAGRTTHLNRLRPVLERKGYAVAETGLSRSDLAARGIRRAKEGNTLGSNAYNLFYATDFADRLERQIVPALRAGFVMLTDRYTYSLIARAIVRGADPDWIKKVYSFSLKPDAVFYLRIQVEDLVPRIVADGGFDYWESGMDLPMGSDLFDSFMNYQTRVIEELDRLAGEYGFETLDATRPVDDTAEDLAERVLALLERRPNLLLELVGEEPPPEGPAT
ncbi:MAG TPA: thymidylate kinase [Candidatus Eisenbacteria bacterium]|nr:thymidylate kinase [Candidatus Eisenbacteria bacterium]